jgi:hypothetical protein
MHRLDPARLSPGFSRDFARQALASTRSPIIYRLVELEFALAAGALGPQRIYQWRQNLELQGMFIFSAENFSQANWAKLFFQIADATNQGIITDGRFPAFAPAFELHGFARRWFALSARVRAGDRWSFQFRNDSASELTPIVMFRYRSEEDPA